MSEFGMCQASGCGQDAIVGLNRAYFCLPHFEAALKGIRQAVERKFLAALNTEPKPTGEVSA